MAQRQEQKEQSRERLLGAAYRLFSRDGILDARTADIARAAHLSHGGVFVHFPTRDDLVTAVLGEIAGQIIGRIHDRVDRDARTRQVLAAHLEGLAEHEPFYARLVIEGPRLPSRARSTLIGIQSAISFHLAAAAQRDTDEGKIRKTSLPLLFNTWLGLLHHYLCNRDLFSPQGRVLERRGPELLDHIMRLLKP